MNSLIQLKKATSVFFVGVACFALFPTAQAVVPAPDGGYPGGNTAEGDNALFSLTTGTSNTATGLAALGSNTTGDFNTAEGSSALLFNTTGSQTPPTGSKPFFTTPTASPTTPTAAF